MCTLGFGAMFVFTQLAITPVQIPAIAALAFFAYRGFNVAVHNNKINNGGK